MNDNKALEALVRIEYNAELDYGITIKHNYKDADLRKDYSVIRSAIVELAEIKKRAEEKKRQIDTIQRKTYTVIALPTEEIKALINYILKGEPK